MQKQHAELDAEELVHLAILDAKGGQHEGAIAKLKRALEQAPANAKAHHLLGAEYAEIGLYDRALEGLNKAVSLDSSLHTAHLQLGLLYFTRGRMAEAKNAWAPLDRLGAEDSLYLFKTGLLKLEAGNSAECVQLLERAAANVRGNLALAKDIRRVIENLQQHRESGTRAPQKVETPHLLATRYQDAGNEER